MGCNPSKSGPQIIPLNKKPEVPRLSETDATIIGNFYDVIVIGSGYGGSIAASRAARAGKSVCVLERGKEWLPGNFPETFSDASREMQVKVDGYTVSGNDLGLYEFVVSEDVTVIKGCGLGGTSLINANVCIEADERVFQDQEWPQDFRDDFDGFKADMERAKTMLRPNVYPNETAKSQQLSKVAEFIERSNLNDIEDLGDFLVNAKKKSLSELHYKTPIAVTTDSSSRVSNHVGVPQPVCNGCGNCVTGCNTGAKNTLDRNYLPDAKYHGARIFTQVKVVHIQEVHEDGTWQVTYTRCHGDENYMEEQVVRADIVIVAAGSLGSAEVLARSKEQGLDISDTIGKGFSGNGDQLGFSYANDEKAKSLALPSDFEERNSDPPGPCITSILDLRDLKNNSTPYEEQLIIEDTTAPTALIDGLKILLFLGSSLYSHDFDPSDDFQQFVDKISGEVVEKTLGLLAMSHDHVDTKGENNSGRIKLDKDGVKIEWPESGKSPNYKRIDEVYKIAAKALGGTYVENPLWSDRLKAIYSGRGTVTVHPLGGCNMAESGKTGVVNHKCQVFEGNTGNVFRGLYVVDGAVMPRSVGINPLLTICGMAERCMRLMADDYNWTINYEFVENPVSIDWKTKKTPGFRVEETMKGSFQMTNSSKTSDLEVNLTLSHRDLVYFVDKDPNHEALVDGVVKCPALSKRPLTAKGTVQLFTNDAGPQSSVDQHFMKYRLQLVPSGSKSQYFFYGEKNIRKNSGSEVGYNDTTTLVYSIYNGYQQNEADKIGQGLIKMPFTSMVNSLTTLKVTNTTGGFTDQTRLKAQFFKLFLGEIYNTYSPFASSQMALPHNRVKRPLNLPDHARPVVYQVLTEDDTVNNLIRYQGGSKGPVLLLHGHGTYSILFTLDTVSENMVEFLVKRKYDVWCLDWRCAPYRPDVHKPFTLDDVAKYDIPSAVDRVLKETNHKDLEVLCHCMGAASFWMSRLLGCLDGKIRCVASLQAGITPHPSPLNTLKVKLNISSLFEAFGVEAMDTYDDELTILDRLHQKISKVVADTASEDYNECKNSVCHKLTLVYGLLWEHNQINNDTHRSLHEMFGAGSLMTYAHILKSLGQGRLVGFKEGEDDLYMPGYSEDTDKMLSSRDAREWLDRLDIPMVLLMSEKNSVFKAPENLKVMHDLVQTAHPEHKDQFEFRLLEGYGHLDPLIGKNANKEIYPIIVSFLDKYAHADTVAYKQAFATVKKGLEDKTVTDKLGEDVIIPEASVQELSDHPDFHFEAGDQADEPDDVDGGELTIDQRIASIMLNIEIPNEKVVVWKKRLHYAKVDKYTPPQPSASEEVHFERVRMGNSRKRDIYSISDTHIAAYFGKGTPARLLSFLEKLTAASFEVHSLVLLGDIIEMWHYTVNEAPPTASQLVERLLSGEIEGAPEVFKALRNLADVHDVKVYFIRGNHDYSFTKEACRDLLGDNVEFIPGILVMEIEEEDDIYRVRFEHGHDWDLFNSFALGDQPDGLLPGGMCLGYYVGRVAASVEYEIPSSVQRAAGILEKCGFDVFGSLVVKLFSTNYMQNLLTEKMLEVPFGKKIHPDQKFLLNDNGDYVTFKNLCKYKLVSRMVAKFGEDRVFDMVKHAIGDYSDFLETCAEDVVVVGHSEVMALKEMPGRHGKLIFANGGAWHDGVEETSYIKITPPRHGKNSEHGRVELNYASLHRQTYIS